MHSKMRLAALLLFCCLAWSPPQAVEAGNVDEGLMAYKSRQYSVALSKFSGALRDSPTDPVLHYYMGMCYQGLGQYQLATQEYKFAATHGTNAAVQNQAKTALSQVMRYTGTQPASNPEPQTKPEDTIPQEPYDPHKIQGLSIIECYTDSCVPCRAFKPVWESVSIKLKDRVRFKRMNIEKDPEFAKYKDIVHFVPTLLWVEQGGQVVNQTEAYRTDSEFVAAVNAFLKKKF